MKPREGLLPELIEIQRERGYLPGDEIERYSRESGLSVPEILGTASFYSLFRVTPPAKHRIKVCVGTACHVKGAEAVYEAFMKHLNIADGADADHDRVFSVEKVSCLGCCMLAPVVQIDDEIFGPVDALRVGDLLARFLKGTAKGKRAIDSAALPNAANPVGTVRICTCTSCRSAGSSRVLERVERHVARKRLPLVVESTGCTGLSHLAPLMGIAVTGRKPAAWGGVTPRLASRLVDEYMDSPRLYDRIIRGADRVLDRLLTGGRELRAFTHDRVGGEGVDPFFLQQRYAFLDSETRNPLDLPGYRARGGLSSLEVCQSVECGKELLSRIIDAGLRGRGGGGFATGEKWLQAWLSPGDEKYVICNGDEGDPGAFMDRMLLESVPFRVIEGAMVAAYILKAREVFFYVRAEYPLAVDRMRAALSILREASVIGEGAAIPELRIPFTVREGAGAFVCGEETALLESMEGRRGIPRPRPPYPSVSGFRGKPTVINNVETFACVPRLIGDPREFSQYGKEGNRGTKSFALAGKIAKPGLVEVSLGTTLRTIVEEIGGGVPPPGEFKAVQIGGPSGGCLSRDALDTPVDYDSLAGVGAMMGSGGMVILDTHDCMVEVARYFTAFSAAESCGRCSACRVGTARLTEILTALTEGRGNESDLAELEETGLLLRKLSRCGLGRAAANPVLSTLQNFPEEYRAHLEGRCPAGVCKKLTTFVVSDRCTGCGLCSARCPVGAIPYTLYERHRIDSDLCVRCGQCRATCPEGAIDVAP